MKSFYSLLFALLFSTVAFAANLTATYTPSDIGKNNGKIALVITGGFAPYTISWTGPGGYSSSKLNPDSLAPGKYCVTVTDQYCGVADLCITVTEKTNSIAEVSTNHWNIYPNPFSNQISIDFGKEMKGLLHLSLYDALGKLVAEQKIEAQSKLSWQLPNLLAAGVYIFAIQTESGELVKRNLVSLGK